MNNKRRYVTLCLTAVTLLVLQAGTYLTLGTMFLKDKLLPEYFASNNYHADSVFVIDYYMTDCYVGDHAIYSSHNLSHDVDFLKRKLNVNYVYVASPEQVFWSDKPDSNYNLFYHTWIRRPSWLSIFGLDATEQNEFINDRTYIHIREAKYVWFLFFWIKTSEYYESKKIETN